jgi:hypothetical protein
MRYRHIQKLYLCVAIYILAHRLFFAFGAPVVALLETSGSPFRLFGCILFQLRFVLFEVPLFAALYLLLIDFCFVLIETP